MGLITTANDPRLMVHSVSLPMEGDAGGAPFSVAVHANLLRDSLRAALEENDRLTLYGNKVSDEYRAALLRAEEAEGQAKRLEAAVGWALENGEEINTFYGRSTWKRELRRRCAKEG